MKNILSLMAASILCVGCNVGMAPEGSTEAAMQEFEQMPLDKKIEFINSSPAPPAEKERLIREAKQKAGVADDSSAATPPNPSGSNQ